MMVKLSSRLFASVGALALAIHPAFAAPPAASSSSPPAVPLPEALADVGVPAYCPFIIAGMGQSNAQGQDHNGDHTIQPNILVPDSLTAPTTLSQAAYGTGILAYGWTGTVNQNTYSASAAMAHINPAVAMANSIRLSGMIPASRPIVIVPDWLGSQSITDWVDGSAAPFDMFGRLQTQINFIGNAYPGCPINYVQWAQGENDSAAVPFTGSISGSTLTVTTAPANAISAGSPVNGPGIPSGTVVAAIGANGTTGTATQGSTGTYGLIYPSGTSSLTIASTVLNLGYGTDAYYLAAFDRLVTRLQGLPRWSSQTRMGVVEAGMWNSNSQQGRNTALRTLRAGSRYPFLTLISAAGLIESSDNPIPHFDGNSINEIGRRHFRAWAAGRVFGSYYEASTAQGGSLLQTNFVTTDASTPLLLGADTCRNGCIITGNGAPITLPNAAFQTIQLPITIVTTAATSLTSGGGGLTVENVGTLGSGVSTTLRAGFTYEVRPITATNWAVRLVNYQNANLRRYTLGTAVSANTSQGSGALNVSSFTGNTAGITATFTPTFGNDWDWINSSSGAQTLTTTAGTFIAPDGTSSTSYTVLPGEYIQVHAGISGTNSLGLFINSVGGVASSRAAENHAISTVTASFTFDATMQAVMVGTRATPLTAAVTGTLPLCTAATKGRSYVIKKRDSSTNNFTLAAAGTDTIDGSTTPVQFNTQNTVVSARCDGAGSWERGLTP